MKRLILALLCASLAACGGGGSDDEDEHADARPPACKENPKLCA